MRLKIIIIAILVVIVAGTAFFFYWTNREEPDLSFSYDPGDYFVTDIQDSRRLLKSDVILHMSDKTRQAFYEENNHQIRNVIIFILRSKSEAELQKTDIESLLNQEILQALNEAFACEEFRRIYFNEFVIQ